MKQIRLTRYGFVRWPEEDFSDDGSNFQCYKAGDNIRVSKLIDRGQYYIRGSYAYGNLTYEEYSKLPHYKALDRLNDGDLVGRLTDADLEQFYNDCIEYEKEYKAEESKLIFPTFEEIKNRAAEEKEEAIADYNKAVAYLTDNFEDIFIKEKVPGYIINWIKDDFRTYLHYINNENNVADIIIKNFYQNRASIDYVNKTENMNCFNKHLYKRVVELIEKYLI